MLDTTLAPADTTATTQPDVIMADGNKHFPYTACFTNDEEQEVEMTFHFRRPQRVHIMTIAKAGKEKSMDSQKEVLVQLCLPDQRPQLRAAFDEYYLLINSFGDEVFKRAGAGAVFAGK